MRCADLFTPPHTFVPIWTRLVDNGTVAVSHLAHEVAEAALHAASKIISEHIGDQAHEAAEGEAALHAASKTIPEHPGDHPAPALNYSLNQTSGAGYPQRDARASVSSALQHPASAGSEMNTHGSNNCIHD